MFTPLRVRYANMMTGNTVSLGMAVGMLSWADAAFFSAAIASYVCGIVGHRLVDLKRRRLPTCTALAPVVGLAFATTDLLAGATRWSVLPLAAVRHADAAAVAHAL